MRRYNLPLILGLVVLAGIGVTLLLPLFVHLDPQATHVFLQDGDLLRHSPTPPGVGGYLLGTDEFGRDLLARVIYGARLTLPIALAIGLLRALLAIPVGLIAGWRGGWAARFTNLFASSISALPVTILAIFLFKSLAVWFVGQFLVLYLTIMVLIGAPRLAEQVRRLTAEVKMQPYIESAVAAGTPTGRILFRHVLPVIQGDLAITMAAELAWVLILMGQMAIFGVMVVPFRQVTIEGIPYPVNMDLTPEWGTLLGLSRRIFRSSPWIPFAGAIAIGVTVASLQLIAEGLRRRWLHR
ncbi:MAG: ABC transporter permease [Mycobacterium leprae]